MKWSTSVQRNRLAWPHRRRGLASDDVRYADARSRVGRRFRSATKLRLEWYGGVFLLLLLQQRSKHPREIVITSKASTSLFTDLKGKLGSAHSRGIRQATVRQLARGLACTRYCFTSKLYCGSPSFFYAPRHLQSLPYCMTIARPLRNIRPPTDPSLYAIHHTLLVMAISCKG